MAKKNKPPEIAPPPESECLEAFHAELETWKSMQLPVRFFLRDDDAIEVTDALKKLVGLCEENLAPLLLAVIPNPAKPELGKALANHDLVTAAIHGYAHANHSPKGEKTCELGRHRPIQTVLGELQEGMEKLNDFFNSKISGLLVPPWNRIHEEVLQEVQSIGFKGVSAHAWLKAPAPLPMVNTHVDIIHWSGGKIGREHNWVLNQITENLKVARQKGGRAVGILTHHLDHDEKAWAMMEKLFQNLKQHSHVRWVHADSLLSEPSEKIL